MRNIIHRLLAFLAVTAGLFGSLLLTGCDVHEFPILEPEQPGPDIPVEVVPEVRTLDLKMTFDTIMPLYKSIISEQNAVTKSQENVDDYDIRYLVNIHSDDGTLYKKYLFSKDDADSLDYTAHIQLEEGDYSFVIWSDFVRAGSEEDLYYNTSDFDAITYKGEGHIGGTDFKDAFVGTISLSVKAPVSASDTLHIERTVQMGRPLAKFRFITTDMKQFVDYAMQKAMENALIGKTASVSLDDYTILFKYNGYMPHIFSIGENRPVDVKTGVTFKCTLEQLGSDEAELGFDYVFVNGSQSYVSVAVDVMDKDGEIISSVNPIEVPMLRSRLTEVRGAFLTSKGTGGIGIDPSYSGDYNIEIK